MSDQAEGLRQLVEARSDLPGPAPRAKARTLLFTSGKGGVGASNLALNLAIALGELERKVVLIDADLGLANLDLLCGLATPVDLGDVLAGEAALTDALFDGPAGVKIVSGAHAMRTRPELLETGPDRIAAELDALAHEADVMIVDAGSGLGHGIATLAAAVDEMVIVTTPEPPSIADAHATIGRYRKLIGARLRVLINQAGSGSEGTEVSSRIVATSRQFLGAVVWPLGVVRSDPHVPLAVRARRPFVLAYPNATASRCVRAIARDLVEELTPRRRTRRPGVFAALAARWSATSPTAR